VTGDSSAEDSRAARSPASGLGEHRPVVSRDGPDLGPLDFRLGPLSVEERTRFLDHLLDPASPQRPLNIYTLHALIASRPDLLSGQPAVRASLTEVLDRFAATSDLSRSERDQLAGLHYAIRIADR